MRVKRLLVAPLIMGLVVLMMAASAFAQSYASIGTIQIPPENSKSFDISWVDPGSHLLYLADRTNKAVDVVDASTGQFVKALGAGKFVGAQKSSDSSGPDGVVVLPDVNQLWAGDGDSTVKVIDLATGNIIQTISTGGKNRADELAYDPTDHLILIANDAEDPGPFLSFISTTSYKVVGKISYPDATDGMEQPIWDAANGMFYQNVPATKQNPGGQIDEIDPHTMKVVKTIPLQGCFPGGLALGPSQHAVVGCNGDALAAGFKASTQVVDLSSGQTIATVPVGASDEVWYNPGDSHYYAAASNMTSDGTKAGTPAPVLAIIDAGTNQLIGTVPTAKSAHSVAADAANNHIFVPIPGKGIMIVAAQAAGSLPKTGAPWAYTYAALALIAGGLGLLLLGRRRQTA